jgi:hypothetical protein
MRELIEINKIGYGKFIGKYEVKMLYRPPMEDMFESVVFSGKFESIHDANRLIAQIKEKQKSLKCFECRSMALNFDLWTWSVTQASCDGRLHTPSTAKEYVFEKSDYAKKLENTYY